jgi:concanavalin A-like lectin/glucanase superfamily protein
MRRRAGLVVLALAAAAALAQPVPAGARVAPAPGTAPVGAPTGAAALAAARQAGRRVEVTPMRTETGQVYANPDGTFTSVENALPVRVRRGADWVPVDTTLAMGRDGLVRPRATTVPTALSGGGDSALVRLSWRGRDVALGWPAALPAPALSGNAATYRDVLPGVDLVVTVGTLGFTQVLVVHTAQAGRNPALAEVHLTTTLTGLRTRADSAGNVSAVDAAGAEVFRSGAPTMWDSSGASESIGDLFTGPATGGRHRPVGIGADAHGFTLRPDRAMLADPATRYPVYIDPNMSYAGSRLAWTAVWKKFPTTTYYNSSDVARVGYEAQEGNTVRSMFRMSTSGVRGKHIISATLRTYEVWSWSCSARSVGLWQTGSFTSSTNWNNQPARTTSSPLVSVGVAKGYSASCPAGGVDFAGSALTNVIASRAASNLSDVTFQLAAVNETDTYAWKKFRNNPTLEVVYNSVPSVPTGLSTDPGLPCITGSGRPVIGTATPTFRAKITDPDSGQPVGAHFEWWNTGGTKIGEKITAKVSSGTVHSATVPSGAFATGRTYSWRVRAEDGTDVSAWAGWCELTVDTTAPKAPTVSSTTYPQTLPGQDPVYKGAIGLSGSFTFSPASGDTDVAGYVYGLNTYPPATSVAAGGTALTATVSLTPTMDLLNTLYVRSKDRAGNLSAIYGYQFYVRPVTFPTGQWKLDEVAGATAADVSGNGYTATLTGGTAWTTGRIGGALALNGTSGAAGTASAVLRTDLSFTVAAWVRFDGATEWRHYTAVSQDGSLNSGFQLGYNTGSDRWMMTMPSADTTTETNVDALSTAPPALHAWTHLVGVYDKAAGQIRLYVDGVKVAAVARTGPWNATGTLQIGRGKWRGFVGNWWNGAVDDVRVYQGVLPDDAIGDLSRPPAQLLGHWQLDETTGTTAVDSSGAGHNATLTGGATWGDGWLAGGLALDGTSGCAGTGTAVLRTDQAFTVSAWVSFAGQQATTNYTALSQDGTGASGFKLGVNLYYGWAIMMPDADSGSANDVLAASPQPPVLNTWTHLAAVYDPRAGQLRLYVDGVLMALTPYSGGWQAGGPLEIGRARWGGWLVDYWNGSIDDVRVYQGALTDDEIYALTLS